MGGGSYSKKLGELSLVDSDSTEREEHAYIGLSYIRLGKSFRLFKWVLKTKIFRFSSFNES